MASAKQILLASLLGGVSGGTNQYLTEKKNQQDYALKRLDVLKPPSEIQSLMYVDPTFANKEPTDKQDTLLKYRSAGAGVTYEGGKKRPLNPDSLTHDEQFISASKRETARKRNNIPSDPTDAAIVNKYKGRGQPSDEFDD